MIDFIVGILTATATLWTVGIVGIIVLAILLEFEEEGWAAKIASIAMALFIFNYRGEIWQFMTDSPGTTIGFVSFYVVSGVAWSFLKWRIFIGEKLSYFDELKNGFLETHTSIKDEWKVWIEYLSHKVSYDIGISQGTEYTPERLMKKFVPEANNRQTLIVSWISYWPVSLSATLLNNPLKKLFNWVYSLISNLYDKMSKEMTKGAIDAMNESANDVMNE